MTEYTFTIEEKIEAESEDEARIKLQTHIDSGNATSNYARYWKSGYLKKVKDKS